VVLHWVVIKAKEERVNRSVSNWKIWLDWMITLNLDRPILIKRLDLIIHVICLLVVGSVLRLDMTMVIVFVSDEGMNQVIYFGFSCFKLGHYSLILNLMLLKNNKYVTNFLCKLNVKIAVEQLIVYMCVSKCIITWT
jgi:hypothetical protein